MSTQGATGGRSDEAGGTYRARVATYLCVHMLLDVPVGSFGFPDDEVPTSVELETGEAVDDIACDTARGRRVNLQAKRALGLTTGEDTPLFKAVGQWRAIAREIDPERQRLLIVTENPTKDALRLRNILEQRRNKKYGTPGPGEDKALETLHGLLGGVPPEQIRAIERAAGIWHLEVERLDDPDAHVGLALLRTHFKSTREAQDAWARIERECRALAKVGAGFDRRELMRLLDAHRLPPTIPGVQDAVRRSDALAGHRARLARGGRTLSFLGLGAAVPPVPLADGDADVEVSAAKFRGQISEQLAWAWRRRGRVVLTGLPGGGKSTALRAAVGQFAERPDWPVPALVSLKDLAATARGESFRDKVLRVAVADAPLADRDALREALDDAVAGGRAALAFDALDEAYEQAHDVARDLQALVSELPPDTEVVVATRAVNHADARILGFDDLELQLPLRPMRIVTAILEALVDSSAPPDEDKSAWVAARRRWVAEAASADATLRETPLVLVMLGLVAAGRSSDRLPTQRAAVLREAVRETASRWKAAGNRLAGLDSDLSFEALMLAFEVEAMQLVRGSAALRQELIATVAEALDEHGIPLPAAAAAAAVSVWDQRGVFVFRGDEASMRLRLFGELGAALAVLRWSLEAQRSWLHRELADPQAEQTIELAAGMAPAVLTALLEGAPTGDERTLNLAVRAVIQAQQADEGALDAFVDALIGDWKQRDDRWSSMSQLARLPIVATETKTKVRAAFRDELEDVQFTVADAMCSLAWAEEGDEVTAKLRAIIEDERQVEAGAGAVDVLFAAASDGVQGATVAAATERLLLAGDAHDELLLAALTRVDHEDHDRLVDLLESLGREEVVEADARRTEAELRWLRAPTDLDQQLRHARQGFLDVIAAAFGPGAAPSSALRRLDETADLWATLRWHRAQAVELGSLWSEHPSEMRALVESIAALSGIDLAVVGAQATQLLNEHAAGDTEALGRSVFATGTERGLSWDHATDPDRHAAQLASLIGAGLWPSVTAARMLAVAPEHLRAEGLIEKRLTAGGSPRGRQHLAALTLLGFREAGQERLAEQWLISDDPGQRTAAAARLVLDADTAGPVLEWLSAEPDEAVVVRAVSAAPHAHDREKVTEVLAAADARPPSSWTCFACGASASVEASVCPNCGGARPTLDLQRLGRPAVPGGPSPVS